MRESFEPVAVVVRTTIWDERPIFIGFLKCGTYHIFENMCAGYPKTPRLRPVLCPFWDRKTPVLGQEFFGEIASVEYLTFIISESIE